MKHLINYQNTPIEFSSKLSFKSKKPVSVFQTPGNIYITKMVILLIDCAFWLQAPVAVVRKNIQAQKQKNTQIVEGIKQKIKEVYLSNKSRLTSKYIAITNSKTQQFNQAAHMILEFVENADHLKFTPFLVCKPSCMGRSNLFEKISKGTSLSKREKQEWSDIKERFRQICEKAQSTQSAKIIIDAEESWVQDCIDELAIDLMAEFNKERAVVFLNVQMYRWDRLDFLLSINKKARKENFKIGVKLDNGDYRSKECIRARVKGYQSPLCIDDETTEKNLNSALRYCIHYLDIFELFSDIENDIDAKVVEQYMERYQVSKEDSRIWFGSIMGKTEGISLYGR
ncbi:proline dehydrogenase family protein [Ascidiimonas sp. W6]|uniref:proline dehydrogenase family protein n=1 Tax=Ascidiimonas meishanensis TaxID=3128903 RepID=UPI0030EBE324